jgi:hypothetical protein
VVNIRNKYTVHWHGAVLNHIKGVGSNHALYTELVVVVVVVQSFEISILLTSQKLANMYLA